MNLTQVLFLQWSVLTDFVSALHLVSYFVSDKRLHFKHLLLRVEYNNNSQIKQQVHHRSSLLSRLVYSCELLHII